VMMTMHVPPISVCLAVDVSIFQMLYVTQKMPATLLHVFLHPDVYLLISLINVTREINVTIILVMSILDAHNPKLTVTTMITVLMTAATQILDVYMHHTTVMMIMPVPATHAVQDSVIMNMLIVTMMIIVLMIVVIKLMGASILLIIVTTIMLVQLITAIHHVDVFTPM